MSETSPDRELPQHWRTDGTPKRKYDTFPQAIVTAHTLSDGAGWLVAYPCYCESFHIGRPRPGVDYEIDLATIAIHLRALGWRHLTVPHYRTGEPLERWERPQRDTHLPARGAWTQVTQAAQREARKVIGDLPIEIPCLDGLTEPEAREIKHRTLIRAGWRAPRFDGDPWKTTRVSKPKSAPRHYTVDQAWTALVARQTILARTRERAGAQ